MFITQQLSRWIKRTPLLQNTCPLCSEFTKKPLCDSCLEMLPNMHNQCLQCGLQLEKTDVTNNALRCGQCLQNPPYFDRCISPYHYALPINQFVTQLKFRHKLHYAKVMAELLINKIEQSTDKLPEVIIPVPLHLNRLRQRGFNQAVEIARPIAKRYRLQIDNYCCRRVISTPPQMEQNKKNRANNIRNAFRVNENIHYKDIAIVDDVMTTGHTLNELSRCFREQGVQRIQVWSVARS